MDKKITYLDIISESIAHFTDLTQEYIKLHFQSLINSNNKNTSMLWSLLKVEFPEKEGIRLLEHLKSLKLVDTMNYISNSMKLYSNQIYRQASYN